MLDPYNRDINYLRISVTDRCNLRCRYCMPEEGVQLMPHDAILTFEEIRTLVKAGIEQGITKVRLTGGEPLVRKDIVTLIKMLAELPGIEDLAMTTNGVLLDRYAVELKKAGLHRVNISLDTMDAEKFEYITRGGDIQKVLDGIDAALTAGLTPVKINCVVRNSSDEPDAKDVKKFGETKGVFVRFIHQMNLEDGTFSQIEGGEGGNCASCNRIRLTADGFFKPCLFNETGFQVRELGGLKAMTEAVNSKPQSGSKNKSGRFNQIGG